MASAMPQTTLPSIAALTASAATQSTSGGSSNLAAVTASGTLKPVVTSGSANIAQFFIAPDQTVYVVFTSAINLSDTTSWEGPRCILAQVDRGTGVPSCVDGTLSWVRWPSPGSGGNPPIQFDAAGAVYYSGSTMTGGTVLRRYFNGSSTNLVSDNIWLRDFLVLPDGDVLLSGSTNSSGASWVRRLTASGSLQTLRGVASSFLRAFPDDNVYMGLWGGTDWGVQRYLTSSNQMEAKSWITGNMGGVPQEAYHLASDYCAGTLQSTRYAFCGFYGSAIQNEIETSNGKVFVVAGYGGGGGGLLMRYYPTVAVATTSIGKVFASVGAGDKIVVAGVNDAVQNKTVVYDPLSDTETQLIGPENEIEIYHLTYMPNSNSVMFEGLRFSDNRRVLGQIDLDTGEVTVSASLPSKLQDLQAFH